MAYERKDFYFREAKADQYAARSVYKLQSIDRSHRLFQPGMRVLDLGAAPGSWSQYASSRVGQRGLVVAVDLVPIQISLPNARFFEGDLREVPLANLIGGLYPPAFDVVLSDMAPRTSGIRFTDQERSAELSRLALSIAEQALKKDGHFVCKLFQGEQFTPFRKEVMARFTRVHIERPPSVRKESKEIYFFGQGFRGIAP